MGWRTVLHIILDILLGLGNFGSCSNGTALLVQRPVQSRNYNMLTLYLLQLAPSLLSAWSGWPFSCAAAGPSAVLTTFSRRPAAFNCSTLGA